MGLEREEYTQVLLKVDVLEFNVLVLVGVGVFLSVRCVFTSVLSVLQPFILLHGLDF